jgi:hypothetical protein
METESVGDPNPFQRKGAKEAKAAKANRMNYTVVARWSAQKGFESVLLR